MTAWHKDRWRLAPVAVGLAGVIVATVTFAIASPRRDGLWLPLLGIVFGIALVCGMGCFLAEVLGSNGRSKAMIGVIVTWVAVGQLGGLGIEYLFGRWAGRAFTWIPLLIFVAVVLCRRDWFRDAEGDSSQPRPG